MGIQDFNLANLDGSNGFRLDGENIDNLFGVSVSDAGDINGDGFDDVIVGAFEASPHGRDSGSSYIVFGKASGFDAPINLLNLDGSNGFRLDGESGGDESGGSVSGAGDVNGDGFDDVIIGAENADPNSDSSGSSYVVFGKATGFAAKMDLSSLDGHNGFRLDGENELDNSGYSVSGAGDVNGDGFADLIVGADGADPNGEDTGSSYVVFGRASGFDSRMNLSSLDGKNGFRLDGVANLDASGNSVSNAGDVNGDGFDDLIVGALLASFNGIQSGSSYVVLGKSSGFSPVMNLSDLDGSNGFRLTGGYDIDLTGYSVSGAGDVNGDGFDDVIVGAPGTGQLSATGLSVGSAFVVFGRASGFDARMDLSSLNGSNGFRLDGFGNFDQFGDSVSGAGDVNGDGVDDLIINGFRGTYREFSGTSYVIFGTTSGFEAQFDLSDLDGQNGFRLNGEGAFSMSSGAGDVNQDGFDDLIVGAGYTNTSYVIFGGPDVTGNLALPHIKGTAAADDLKGTADAEYLSAAAGDDVLSGGGGADKFDGGEGDDVICLPDTNLAALDGGTGEDTLRLLGSGMNLDLTQLADRIHHIETINLQGEGDNTLVLTVDSIPSTHENSFGFGSLTVQGNEGDRVAILDKGWTDAGIVDGFHTYTNPDGALRVQEVVQVDFEPAVEHIFNVADLDGTNGFRLNGENIGNGFGESVSDAGDINGDGFDDVIVGAHFAGSTYVVFGATSGFDAQMDVSGLDGSNGFRLDGENINDPSGLSVSSAGDVNGDGFDDVIVGADGADSNGRASGSSYVVFGKASGFDAQMNLSSLDGRNGFRLDGEHGYDFSGRSVSGAGDVNGDGFDDVIVGATRADPNDGDSGSSYVVFGKASGFDAWMNLSNLDGHNGFRLDGEHKYDSSGLSVSSAGDVNGDGFDDVIVGATGADQNGDGSGSSYVVFGKASGFDAQMNLSSLDGRNGFRLDGESIFDGLGSSVSSAGDVNGDGFEDMIVNATGAVPNGEDSGSSYVIFGRASGFGAEIDLSSLDGDNGFRLDGEEHSTDISGTSVSGAGDINGDGYDDLIIGSVSSYQSHGYVIFGKASGFDAQIDLGNLSSDGFRLDDDNPVTLGSSVSGAGDINGDGLDDLIIGASEGGFRSYYYTPGMSYVIFGSRDIGQGGERPEIEGTEGDDTLKGSEAAEHFIAGDGNDNLLGLGGADIFDAGAGDDAIRIGDLTFASIDGGEGNDALHLAGSGMNLDLSALGDQIHNIETICLYGRGDNTLTLTADSLLNLSDATHILKVHGNTGDHIVMQDDDWVDGGGHGFYHTYTHDDAVLLVGVNVAVEFV